MERDSGGFIFRCLIVNGCHAEADYSAGPAFAPRQLLPRCSTYHLHHLHHLQPSRCVNSTMTCMDSLTPRWQDAIEQALAVSELVQLKAGRSPSVWAR